MKNIIKNTILFLFITVCSIPAYTNESNGIRANIIEIANQLEAINRFDCEAVGLDRNKPESYKLYEQLTTNATVKELIQLVEHQNAVVQCYSIKALGEKSSVDMLPILLSQLSNTKNMVALCGSSQQTQKVCDYVYAQLMYFSNNGRITLSENMKDQVYENILYNDYSDYVAYIYQLRVKSANLKSQQNGQGKILANYHTTALDDVLLKIQPKTAYYKRIREITTDSICENAIIALAKYRQQADIALIKKYYPKFHVHTTWLNAIAEFPDPGFIDDLFTLQLQYLDKQYCRSQMVCKYYIVLLQYKNQESLEIIKYGLENMKFTKNQNCHLEALYAALEMFPDPYYKDIKNNIPLTQKQKDRVKAFVKDYLAEDD